MTRYIDADKLNKKKKYSFQTQGLPFPKSEWFIKADDLFSAPTADVVEVVRCKDCMFYKHTEIGDCMACVKYTSYKAPNDYCSCGKLKEREGK